MLRRDFLKTLALGASAAALAPAMFAETVSAPKILLGIDVLEQRGFADIKNLRAGLVTHPAGVNRRGERTMDVLIRGKAKGVKLAKLFGPEHGIYGTEKAEVPVQNTIDRRTGIPVFSLYGKTRRPTPDMLAGLDIMLIDLQDIGCRSYTYVSCMRLVIEACFEAGVQVMVLDRPNPMGGLLVDGPALDKEFESYVGMYPVPYVHGLTIGELARMAVRSPGWLELSPAARAKGKLRVMPMKGWTRGMQWEDTGLRWVPTSPVVTTPDAAKGYGMTGLGCYLGDFYHGYKSASGSMRFPFRWVGYPGKKAQDVARELRRCAVPGLDPEPKMMPDGGQGVYLAVPDWNAVRPCEVSFHMMRLACLWSRKNPFAITDKQAEMFNKHMGSRTWFNELRAKGARADVRGFLARTRVQCEAFRTRCKPFLLYS